MEIWHGVVVQAHEACTVVVVRIVSGEFLKDCWAGGLMDLE